jgi:hypothetical protein
MLKIKSTLYSKITEKKNILNYVLWQIDQNDKPRSWHTILAILVFLSVELGFLDMLNILSCPRK